MMNHQKRPTFSIVCFLLFGCAMVLNGELKEESWAFKMDFAYAPEENLPAWKRKEVGSAEAWVKDSKLFIKSEPETAIYFTLQGQTGDAVWDGTKASTVRFRARVINALDGESGGAVSIRCGERLFNIPVSDHVERTYHFFFEEAGDGRLFIDGIEQSPVMARPMADKNETNAIIFGDLGRFSGGETEWSDFRWTNQGAFEP